MNYRHAFHAGNFADVLKHVVLGLCLERLNQKDKPYRFIDTHAGAGIYDLAGEEAARSPEWREGVRRVIAALPSAPPAARDALAPWLAALAAANPGGGDRFYPGSPFIAASLMRAADRIRLAELHPETALSLSGTFRSDVRVKIEQRDGYEALGAYLPPPERRGLALIDPPFEEGEKDRKADFPRMLKASLRAVRRWPGGVYLLWRPLKHVAAVEAFDAEVASRLIEEAGIAPDRILLVDQWVRRLNEDGPLSGAGLMIINPPFGVRERLEGLMPWLTRVLAQAPAEAGFRLETPAPDQA